MLTTESRKSILQNVRNRELLSFCVLKKKEKKIGYKSLADEVEMKFSGEFFILFPIIKVCADTWRLDDRMMWPLGKITKLNVWHSSFIYKESHLYLNLFHTFFHLQSEVFLECMVSWRRKIWKDCKLMEETQFKKLILNQKSLLKETNSMYLCYVLHLF